jgi:hypothetical protein
VVVPSGAGAYVSGDSGSNVCPAGSARIETEAACRTAAAAGKTVVGSDFVETYPFVQTRYDSPRGCYYLIYSNVAYFNDHADGAGSYGTQLLCAAFVTTGAPLHAPTRRRACAARYSRAVRLIIQTA